MNKKTLVASIIVVLILIAGVLHFSKTKEVVVTNEPTVGAAGQDFPGPSISVSGVEIQYARNGFVNATTTPCFVKSPAATSTLLSAGWTIRTGTTTVATIDMGTSTSQYSTTTNLVAARSVASGAQDSVSWSPSGSMNAIMAPNTFLVVKTAGAGLGGYTYKGFCSAVFQTL